MSGVGILDVWPFQVSSFWQWPDADNQGSGVLVIHRYRLVSNWQGKGRYNKPPKTTRTGHRSLSGRWDLSKVKSSDHDCWYTGLVSQRLLTERSIELKLASLNIRLMSCHVIHVYKYLLFLSYFNCLKVKIFNNSSSPFDFIVPSDVTLHAVFISFYLFISFICSFSGL